MAKRGSKSTDEIQRLLEERRKVEQWLQRLNMAADKTAADVRERVQGDYEARLNKVVAELQKYGDDLRSSLASQRATYADYKTQESAASEELAEAELRHAVGEFAEEEWSERKAEILEMLVKIREQLADAETEMSELEDVLRELEAPAATGASSAPAAPPAEQRLSLGSELGLRDLGDDVEDVGEVASAPAAKPSKGASFTDELAFLKSVTETKGDGGETGASGKRPAIVDQPATERSSGEVGAKEVQRLSGARSVEQSRPSSMNQRTLKCGECGAMNLPTEWYCDRCGAELAAL